MKKILIALLALLLTLSLSLALIGCDELPVENGGQSTGTVGGSSGNGGSSGSSGSAAGNSSGNNSSASNSSGSNSSGQGSGSGSSQGSGSSGGNGSSGTDVISIRNLYFANWGAEQGDSVTQWIEEKFNTRLETSTYSFEHWTEQVNADVIGNQIPDVFQANVTSYNMNDTYLYWATQEVVKPLPDDLSPWPNLKKMIDNTKDIEYLKYNGKLYGIPIARNINRTDSSAFAPFTYLYRRDVAKRLNVYQEGDIYTWDQFLDVLAAFKTEFSMNAGYALGDAEWGYPSILNFYKTAPHCFATDASGQIVNNYYTSEYLAGLEVAKSFVNNHSYYLGQLQDENRPNMVKRQYTSMRLGIFYENLSLSNYLQIRDDFTKNGVADSDLDDYTAIMKVMGPDGKYALEEQESWYSMTFLNYDMSDAKMRKILDLMDFLLSEEGTMLALYGIEGVDYEITTEGDIELIEGDLWAKNAKEEYINSPNGARYLRYMVTLGEDIIGRDPLILQSRSKMEAYSTLTAWEDEMETERTAGNLKVLSTDPAVKWMQTPNKLENAAKLLDSANAMVIRYAFSIKTATDYAAEMTSSEWTEVLEEINNALSAS